MERVVVQRSLVQKREVPDVEVDRPERQRDEWVGQDSQPRDRADREHRPEDRAREADDERERREIADDHVLEHVREEELLLPESIERRHERQEQEHERRCEGRLPPPRHGRAAARERSSPFEVHEGAERDRRELERVERPTGPWRRHRQWIPLESMCEVRGH
jgi:hypothetical protein